MKRIISYNVNGLRSAMSKGWMDWLKAAQPDVLCLQELKADPSQLPLDVFKELGYHTYWHPAEKKGYSGVAIFSKDEPLNVTVGCGIPRYDREGRVLRADFGNYSVMSVYFPSGSSGDERQAFKMEFLADFVPYVQEVRVAYPHIVLCGDVNICHQAIDIHNPVSNKNSSGFLPEERAWLDGFIKSGYVDSFRNFHAEPHQYTWWSFRFNARKQNKGWRIDYQLVSEALASKMLRAAILADAVHSDHCPTLLELDL